MVIGKTYDNLTSKELFRKYPEVEVLTAVFPEVRTLPYKMCSPLRRDQHPSFTFFLNDNGNVRFKDFGDNSAKGDLITFLCMYWKCSFKETMQRIVKMMEKADRKIADFTARQKNCRIITRREQADSTKIQVTVRQWKDYDYEYWQSYGITPKWLHFADIHPISHKIITKYDNGTETGKYIFPADKYAYCFVERKDGQVSLKIYQPFNTRGFKWCSKMDSSVWGLWTKIPWKGDTLIISSSVKDCLNISCQLHIPAICMQGEGYMPKPQIMEELKSRYRKIIVFFDNDSNNENNPGHTDSIKLAEKYSLESVEIPSEYGAKDPSDLYRKYGKKKYLKIMHSILDPLIAPVEAEDEVPY